MIARHVSNAKTRAISDGYTLLFVAFRHEGFVDVAVRDVPAWSTRSPGLDWNSSM
jgi:hypothetical protein